MTTLFRWTATWIGWLLTVYLGIGILWATLMIACTQETGGGGCGDNTLTHIVVALYGPLVKLIF